MSANLDLDHVMRGLVGGVGALAVGQALGKLLFGVSTLLVGRLSFQHRHLDAGCSAGMAGAATNELAVLAGL